MKKLYTGIVFLSFLAIGSFNSILFCRDVHVIKPIEISNPQGLIKFTPSKNFTETGVTGAYDQKKQTATINNKSLAQDTYTIDFEHVVTCETNCPHHQTLIGSYKKGTGHHKKTIYLYGDKITDNTVATSGTSKKNVHIASNLDFMHNPSSNDAFDNDIIEDSFVDDKSKIISDVDAQLMPGSSSATYAPQIFDPEEPFAAPGMVGNYFAATAVATIHNPQDPTVEGYTFTQVISDQEQVPQGHVLIGSYRETSSPVSKNGISSHAFAIKIVKLYGVLA